MFAGRRMAVVGDLMMDEYLWGRATRISPESPVMVVEVDRETSVPGGAANVVNNLLAFGAQVRVIGLVGDDAAGEELRESLRARGADVSGIVTDSSRPTSRKTRVVAHSQQVLRIDREQRHSPSNQTEAELVQLCSAAMRAVEGIVISDYDKGVLSQGLASALLAAASTGVFVAANPKPANARLLPGISALSVNLTEAQALAQDSRFANDDAIEAAGAELAKSLDVERLIVTRGAKGLSIWTRDGSSVHLPAHPVEVYDVAGAGDTVVSALTLGLVCGAETAEAAEIANHAAACVVRKVGVATVSPDELIADW